MPWREHAAAGAASGRGRALSDAGGNALQQVKRCGGLVFPQGLQAWLQGQKSDQRG